MPITIERLPIAAAESSRLEIWYILEDGVSAVAEFIFGLQRDQREKLLALLRRSAEHGLPQNTERFKSLSGHGNLYEFKSFNVRVFCFRDADKVILAEGCVKKSDRADARTRNCIERAQRRKKRTTPRRRRDESSWTMYTERLRELIEEAEKTAGFQYERVVVDLTETICEIMEQKGISRAQLAERMGKSKAWVTKLLRGDHNMTLKTVVTLLWELGYKVDVRVSEAELDRDADAERSTAFSWVLLPSKLESRGVAGSGQDLRSARFSWEHQRSETARRDVADFNRELDRPAEPHAAAAARETPEERTASHAVAA